MRTSTTSRRAATTIGAAGFLLAGVLAGTASPAQAVVLRGDDACVHPATAGASARGGFGPDTRDVSVREQRRIGNRTDRLLSQRGGAPAKPGDPVAVPVYVHVMAASDGSGDVSDQAIDAQLDVLNETYGGGESTDAADTGFTFTLAGVDRYYNDVWHQDHASSKYRKLTRQGGAEALNMWLVDFKYLGIATFPWDYRKHGGVDGIRVHYASLPGGSIANYNFGETATHEAGHWLGLYHTFQGGCTELNDEVADTPAQDGPTSGCPEGRDSCPLPGLDPIHNYMDYSYDTCYTQFTSGQGSRMQDMWAAYRG